MVISYHDLDHTSTEREIGSHIMRWYDDQKICLPNKYSMMTMLSTYKMWLNREAPHDQIKSYYQLFDETYAYMS